MFLLIDPLDELRSRYDDMDEDCIVGDDGRDDMACVPGSDPGVEEDE